VFGIYVGFIRNQRKQTRAYSGSTRHKFEHVTCERRKKKKANETL